MVTYLINLSKSRYCMVEILVIMAMGILCGFLLRRKEKIIRLAEPLLGWSVYILLFLIGIGVGVNKIVVERLGVIGIQALLLTLGAVIGSSLMALLCYRLFFRKSE